MFGTVFRILYEVSGTDNHGSVRKKLHEITATVGNLWNSFTTEHEFVRKKLYGAMFRISAYTVRHKSVNAIRRTA